MLLSLSFVVALSLSATPLILSAPLNERRVSTLLRRQAPEGWLCHYDGPADTGVDPSLDLPTMLEGLCAKVKYAYVGCESFHSKAPKRVEPIVAVSATSGPQSSEDSSCPGSDGQSPLSACVNLFPIPANPDAEPSSGPLQAQSAPGDDTNDDHKGSKGAKKPKRLSKHHKAHHATKAQPDQNLGAQSFDESPSDAPDNDSNPKSHHDRKPKFKKTHHKSHSSDPEPSSDVASKSIGEDPSPQNECTESQYFSSEAGQCVDKSFYSQPNDDSTCQKGKLDVVLHLCLDLSLLGLDSSPSSSPAADTIDASGLQPEDGSDEAQDDKCAVGQKYSSLVSACVEDKLFAKPSNGNECRSGWGLEPILGICLDILSCPGKNDSLL